MLTILNTPTNLEYVTGLSSRNLLEEYLELDKHADNAVHIHNLLDKYKAEFENRYKKPAYIRLDTTYPTNSEISSIIKKNRLAGNRFILKNLFILYDFDFIKSYCNTKGIEDWEYVVIDIPEPVRKPLRILNKVVTKPRRAFRNEYVDGYLDFKGYTGKRRAEAEADIHGYNSYKAVKSKEKKCLRLMS